MQGEPHISAHENGPPFSSSGDAMIHRLCTEQLIRENFLTRCSAPGRDLVLITLDSQTLVNNSGDITSSVLEKDWAGAVPVNTAKANQA